MIIALENLLSQSQVTEAKAMLEQADWVDGKTTAGHLALNCKNNLQLPVDSQEGQQLGDFILARLHDHPLFNSAALANKILPPMFNCYQAIGAVNALRSNYNFTMLPGTASSFGSCKMKIDNTKAEPPEIARGRISRTYLYMDKTYKEYSMSKQQKQLMVAWDKMYPVDQWECTRAKKITRLQHNNNDVVMSRCKARDLW